jgi:peptidoglycan/xylan/chitin deacetylase (PgdA/CDA1 family)
MRSGCRTPTPRAISRSDVTRVTLPPVLCYHKVERRHELGVTRISPRRFARHIERLARAGWKTLGLSEVIACAIGERVAAPNELAITFDDGYRGLREHAFPVLEAVGFSATCFVITEYAGRLNRWDVAYGGRRFAHLAWRDMRAWQGRGIEFASHTATHPRLTRVSELGVYEELDRSRRAIAGALGVETPAVSYPFGAAGEREEGLARDAGYAAGFGIARGWSGSAMSIARAPVYLWAPMMPVVGVLSAAERAAGVIANRCAIGTTLLRSAT